MLVLKFIVLVILFLTFAGLADHLYHGKRWNKWVRFPLTVVCFVIGLELFQMAVMMLFDDFGVPMPSWMEWLMEEE
ncbi:hypothetical protein HBP98_01545 [Listeria booriae]|uniref:Uncharacterized protein n=1 Tax=Listeria booriae TaxID=1552123 RepID=A0A7X1A3N1_9LIST|nr:hypothetical protein [Listeria booriae]MBC2370679.1 hypothetical protein [Listeria booriae]